MEGIMKIHKVLFLCLAIFTIALAGGSVGYDFKCSAQDIKIVSDVNGVSFTLTGSARTWLCNCDNWLAYWSDPETKGILSVLLTAQANGQYIQLGYISGGWTTSCYSINGQCYNRLAGVRIVAQ
jgi:hypothetical protein